ncbi:MAG: hypothetical protein L3J72_05030, partial [Thermoplasmata archaeon]|nr:hypothetical protein [Thermoplasmata archaeon]
NGVIDPMLRIPLMYRPVGGVTHPQPAQGWASIIDIAPTVLQDAAAPPMNLPSAIPLQQLVEAPRPGPVFAVSDGLVWNHLKKVVPEARKPEFDRLRVVAYLDGWKLVQDATWNQTHAYDLTTDPGELSDRWSTAPAELVEVAAAARGIAAKKVQGPPAPLTDEIEERLRSWGYL